MNSCTYKLNQNMSNPPRRPIGVPLLRKVTIHNINGHSSIQMLSISGNTIHFHCSFFNDKVSLSEMRKWTV